MEIKHLLQQLQPAIKEDALNDLKQALQDRIAYLIEHDFEKLVQLLYTIDVDEKGLKHLLQQQQERDAAEIITELIMERQLQKMAARQQTQNNTDATDEERW